MPVIASPFANFMVPYVTNNGGARDFAGDLLVTGWLRVRSHGVGV